jgi:hypothetical protein
MVTETTENMHRQCVRKAASDTSHIVQVELLTAGVVYS